MKKRCKQCDGEKDIQDFRHQTRNDRVYVSGVCKKCDSKNGRKHWNKFAAAHRDEIREKNRKYYALNKTEIKERQKDRKKVWDRNYYTKNKSKIRKNQLKRTKERYHSEPNFRIRKTVSKSISRQLRLNGSSKNRMSCLNFLPYTMEQLKTHLESLFEPWMTWDNYGIYNKKIWDDNNPHTWTWQIDHVIPHSTFNYISMEEQVFLDCWTLDNLRPLSAKTNNLDGVQKTRHGVK